MSDGCGKQDESRQGNETVTVAVLIHLPKDYNPDSKGVREPIPAIKFYRTAKEISMHFWAAGQSLGGGIIHWNSMTGFWADQGYVDVDNIVLLQVDIIDMEENREWLGRYARRVLSKRFKQKAIFLEFVPVRVLLASAKVVPEDKQGRKP